jgi:MFS family permease
VAAWGRASDRFGRRPVLLAGLLGTAVSQVVFGMATSYPVALAARFMIGALNANIATCKVYMGEITTAGTQAKGFGWLSFTWGLGAVTAPAVGGWLADPATAYPDSALAHVQLLIDYPYILPAAVSCGFSVVAFVLGYFALPETDAWLRTHRRRGSQRKRGAAAAAAAAAAPTRDGASADAVPAEGGGDDAVAGVEVEMPVARKPRPRPPRAAAGAGVVVGPREGGGGAAGGAGEDDDGNGGIAPAGDEDDEDETAALVAGTPSKHKDADRAAGGKAGRGARAGRARGGAAAPPALLPPRLPQDAGIREIVRDRAVVAAIANYGLLAAAQILFDELFPVFAKTDAAQGGLGWRAGDVGSLQVVQGATQIVCNLFVFPWLARRYGLVWVFRHTVWPLVPLMAVFPATARLAPFGQAALWAGLGVGIAGKAALMASSFTAVMLLINNSSRGAALGAINGVAQSVASLVRAVGPTLGGALFSASLRADALGAARLHTVYGVMALIAMATFAASYTIPTWCNEAPDVVGDADQDDEADGDSGDGRRRRRRRRRSQRGDAVAAGPVAVGDNDGDGAGTTSGRRAAAAASATVPTVKPGGSHVDDDGEAPTDGEELEEETDEGGEEETDDDDGDGEDEEEWETDDEEGEEETDDDEEETDDEDEDEEDEEDRLSPLQEVEEETDRDSGPDAAPPAGARAAAAPPAAAPRRADADDWDTDEELAQAAGAPHRRVASRPGGGGGGGRGGGGGAGARGGRRG